jgi:cytochrome c oxidase assembly factor CtaG
MAVAVLFVSGLGSGALAALLTLSPTALYSVHANTTVPWHLTPLEDQQLAGAIMWVPGGLIYAVAALILLVQWLERPVRAPRPLVPVLAGDA